MALSISISAYGGFTCSRNPTLESGPNHLPFDQRPSVVRTPVEKPISLIGRLRIFLLEELTPVFSRRGAAKPVNEVVVGPEVERLVPGVVSQVDEAQRIRITLCPR